MPRIQKATTRHELDRVIVGNQLVIMNAFAAEFGASRGDLEHRINATRAWWRHHFSEEVGVLPPTE